jgi:hypothetical protein
MNLREFNSSSPASLFNYEEQQHYSQQANHLPSPNQNLFLQLQQQQLQLQQQQQANYDSMRMMNRTNYLPPPPPPNSLEARYNSSMIPSPPSASGLGGASSGPGSPALKRPEATFVMDISPSVVGWIIGRSGIRIKEIQAQTGCKMWVDQDVPNDQPRKIYFHGNKVNIDAAVGRVSELVQSAPILASASVTSGRGLTSTIVDCPVSLVGLLIGKRGWTIKKIQQASGAQISINQSVREGLPRKIIVSGDEVSVATALHLIDEVLRDKSGMSQEHEPSFDPSSPGMNMYLGGALDTFGRLDSPVYDPRLQSQGQAGSMYRQQYQSMSGTPPLMMQSSLRYPSPSPVSLRSGDDPRSRMGSSYESSLQMLHEHNGPTGFDTPSDHYNAGSVDSTFSRPSYFPDEQNGTNPFVDEYIMRKNAEIAEGEPWNNQSYSGEQITELNFTVAQESPPLSSSRQNSKEDASLLSYHLRQQHQRSQQQSLNQGHVFPLTQGKMIPRQQANQFNNAAGGAQPIFTNSEYSQHRGGSMMIPASPIDPSRSFSDSSMSGGAHRSSHSNSFHSSTLSESPLNAGLFHFACSPATTGVSLPHAGIALVEEHQGKSRSRLSSSSSSESYLDHHGHITRAYSLQNSADPYSANGYNRNQLEDLNALAHSHGSFDMPYPSSSLQPPRDHISRSLPNTNFDGAPTSGVGRGYSSSSPPVTAHDSMHLSSASFPSHSRQSFLPSASPFEINTDPYASHGRARDTHAHALYSPLYSHSTSGSGVLSLPSSASPPKQAPVFNEDSIYGCPDDLFAYSAHDNPPTEGSSFSGLLASHPEGDTLTPFGSGGGGSAYDNKFE